MISRRIFEIANIIHHKLASECDTLKPMEGKQIIIVGDFLQLPPVQNLFDPGAFAFNSPVFVKSILHRVELKTLWRQDSSETKFLQCLKELRIGNCSKESSNFIQNLSRELPYSIGKDAVHIYF